MSTTYYLPSAGAAPVAPAVGAVWDQVGAITRLPLPQTPTDTALVAADAAYVAETTATAPWDVFLRQYVSDPIGAQTITGTFAFVSKALESAGTADMFVQLRIAVVSGDGATLRGELYAGNTATTLGGAGTSSQEMSSGGTRVYPNVAVTPVAALNGDRVVVEVGYRALNVTTSSRSGGVQQGDPASGTDYALAADTGVGTRPWLQFSHTITAETPPPEPVEPGYYRVILWVGDQSWTIEKGDPAAYGPTDDLRIWWAIPEGEARPAQPPPVEASFGIVVEDPAEFTADVGAPVSIAVFSDPDTVTNPPFTFAPLMGLFAGRIAELEATPHELGIVYDVKCVSYLADLIAKQTTDIGAGPDSVTHQDPDWWNYTQRGVDSYCEVLMEQVGYPSPLTFITANDEPTWTLHSLGNGNDSVFNHLTRVLGSHVGLDVDPAVTGVRGVIQPQISWDTVTFQGELYEAQPFVVSWFAREARNQAAASQGGMLPARLAFDGTTGLWYPHVDPEDDTLPAVAESWPHPHDASFFGVLPAATVELDSVKWYRNKAHAVDTVETQWKTKGDGSGLTGGKDRLWRSTNRTPTVPTTRSLGMSHICTPSFDGSIAQPKVLAVFALPETGEARAFQADRFKVRPAAGGADPHRISSHGWRHLCDPYIVLGHPIVTIAGVPDRWNPNPDAFDWYAGSLRGAELRIKDGDYTFDLLIDQDVPRPAADEVGGEAGYLTYENMRAYPSWASIPYEDVDPRMQWLDMRLVRAPETAIP